MTDLRATDPYDSPKKLWFAFSPLLVILSIAPFYIFTGKAEHMGLAWIEPVGKWYLIAVAPIYFVVSTLVVLYWFIVGKHVHRLISGIVLTISAAVFAVLFVFVQVLGGLP